MLSMAMLTSSRETGFAHSATRTCMHVTTHADIVESGDQTKGGTRHCLHCASFGPRALAKVETPASLLMKLHLRMTFGLLLEPLPPPRVRAIEEGEMRKDLVANLHETKPNEHASLLLKNTEEAVLHPRPPSDPTSRNPQSGPISATASRLLLNADLSPFRPTCSLRSAAF